MPNWVTNQIKAPSHVVAAMVGTEGRIDFNTMAPFPGPATFEGIYCDAETAAEAVLNVPLSDHPLIAALEQGNRQGIDLSKLNDTSFEQFIGMLRNHRACGYLHDMDFARKVWGTKWNACEPQHDIEAGTASFETAWSCPRGVLIELSKRFPNEEIAVTFADEDIGSNCGTFTLKAGELVAEDIAPSWRDQSEAQRQRWTAFAHGVKGTDPADYED